MRVRQPLRGSENERMDWCLLAGNNCGVNREKITREFIERRLLDKLMYWEGWSLKKGELPPMTTNNAG
jgi:hypothetical protein